MSLYTPIQDILQEYHVDAMLVMSYFNLRYVTGGMGGGAALITKRGKYFFTDPRYIEDAQRRIREASIELCPPGTSLLAKVREQAEADGVKRFGFEESSLSIGQYTFLTESAQLELVPCQALINRLIAVKGPWEKAKMIAAQRLAEEAFDHTLQQLHVGMTEKEAAAILVYQLLHLGADKSSFGPIVVSGARSSLPHGTPSHKKIESGDFLTMDFGCVLDGWCSDMTRTVAFGHVTDEMRLVYDTVLRAQEAGIATARANIQGKLIHEAAMKVIADAGYAAYFTHGFGHGIGMAGHEDYGAGAGEEKILPVGAMISAEPGIYIPGRFGVRIEDVLYLTENGCENLMQTPKELLIL